MIYNQDFTVMKISQKMMKLYKQFDISTEYELISIFRNYKGSPILGHNEFEYYVNKGVDRQMIKFDKLFETLKENGISQYRLYTYYGISRSQIHRLKSNQSVTTHTLDILLNILGEGFTLDDIAEFIPDPMENAG